MELAEPIFDHSVRVCSAYDQGSFQRLTLIKIISLTLCVGYSIYEVDLGVERVVVEKRKTVRGSMSCFHSGPAFFYRPIKDGFTFVTVNPKEVGDLEISWHFPSCSLVVSAMTEENSTTQRRGGWWCDFLPWSRSVRHRRAELGPVAEVRSGNFSLPGLIYGRGAPLEVLPNRANGCSHCCEMSKLLGDRDLVNPRAPILVPDQEDGSNGGLGGSSHEDNPFSSTSFFLFAAIWLTAVYFRNTQDEASISWLVPKSHLVLCLLVKVLRNTLTSKYVYDSIKIVKTQPKVFTLS